MPDIIEKRVKSADNAEIYYKISKPKNKSSRPRPCIFFLHGLGLNNTCFKKEQGYFSDKGFITINMDLRGHGNSESKGNLSLQSFAGDVRLILKKERIKKAVIAGHSFGGMIALQFCSMFQDMAKALILIDSSYKLSLITIRPSFLLFDFLPCKVLTALGYRQHKKEPDTDFTRYKHNFQIVYKSIFATDRRTIKKCIKSMKSSMLEERLEKIKKPVLIIETRDDEIFSKLSYRIMHKKIKNSRLDIIEGHHEVPISDPRSINREMMKFIKKVKPGP
ncbi:alpha/beta hydrolase [Candidatus Woesearchaeota archaeon]|nr:alpha/beta hydrolase [Candidatus Woesearchaeota archaeon]